MAAVKVAFVGGGSYQWGIAIARDLLVTKGIDGSEMVLMDLDPKAAKDVQAAAMATQRRAKSKWTIRTEQVRTFQKGRPGLKDADFVVISVSTGGFDSMEHDLNVPWKYGAKQTVGDTAGPGGLNRALRNIPVFVDLMEDIQRQCPNAWVLNLTNPMTTLTQTLCRTAGDNPRVVGLCHEVTGGRRFIAGLLGLDMDDPTFITPIAGINHCIWLLDVSYRGQNLMDTLRRAVGDRAFADEVARRNGQAAAKKVSGVNPTIQAQDRDNLWKHNYVKRFLMQQTGYLPMVGDRHIVEFFGHFTPDEQRLREHWHCHYTTIEDRRQRWLPPMKQNTLEIAAGKKKQDLNCSHEPVAPIIDAIANSRPYLLPAGNLRNVGQIANLPAGAVVETPCVVTAAGVKPVCMGALPHAVAAVVAPHCHRQELIVQSGLTADKALARAALISDPMVQDAATADAMLDEMMQATRQWLPQFFPKKAARRTARKGR